MLLVEDKSIDKKYKHNTLGLPDPSCDHGHDDEEHSEDDHHEEPGSPEDSDDHHGGGFNCFGILKKEEEDHHGHSHSKPFCDYLIFSGQS